MAVGVILSVTCPLLVHSRPTATFLHRRTPTHGNRGAVVGWVHSSTDARDRDVCRFTTKWHWVSIARTKCHLWRIIRIIALQFLSPLLNCLTQGIHPSIHFTTTKNPRPDPGPQLLIDGMIAKKERGGLGSSTRPRARAIDNASC